MAVTFLVSKCAYLNSQRLYRPISQLLFFHSTHHAAFAPERPWQKKRALEMDLLVSQSSGGTADGRRLTALAVRVFFVRRAKFERGI